MNTDIILGFQFDWLVVAVVIMAAVCASMFAESAVFGMKIKSVSYWIVNVLLSACVFGLVVLITVTSNGSSYIYDGIYSDNNIYNVQVTGSNVNTGNSYIKYSNEDGSVEEICEDVILCVNGNSRNILYVVKVNCWLYDDVKIKRVLALNYNDYIKVVGNIDSLLKSNFVMSVIKDCNLIVSGLNNRTHDNIEPIKEQVDTSNKNVENVEYDSDIIDELMTTIKQKDDIIQEYADKNKQLETDIASKDAIIAENETKIEKLTKDNEKKAAKLRDTNRIKITSMDFINICIGIGILVLVGMGVVLMIAYTKHKLAKVEMTLKSELKIREGVMLDKDLK